MSGLIIGFVAGLVLMAFITFLVGRRARSRHVEEIQRYDDSIVDLRQERAEDKETNRRLRHELAARSPDRLIETAATAELDRDNALSERDQALDQLQLVQHDLTVATNRLADREAKLRQYREALHEIRVSLEAQDRTRTVEQAELIGSRTDDVPADLSEGLQADVPADVPSDVPADVMAQVESAEVTSGD